MVEVHGRITVGRYEVVPLLDGVQDLESAGGIVDFFASPSNDVWDPYRRYVDTGRLLAPVHFEEPFGRVVTDGELVAWQAE